MRGFGGKPFSRRHHRLFSWVQDRNRQVRLPLPAREIEFSIPRFVNRWQISSLNCKVCAKQNDCWCDRSHTSRKVCCRDWYLCRPTALATSRAKITIFRLEFAPDLVAILLSIVVRCRNEQVYFHFRYLYGCARKTFTVVGLSRYF